jgi:hypothetical protein
MLSRVVVNAHQPNLQSEFELTLELENARPDDSIIVDKIDGLDPPDIDLYLGDYARDGGYYSGRRVGKRNPVFHLTLNPNYAEDETVSDLREALYRAFIDPRAAGDDVRVDLIDDRKPPRYFSGFTEKIESPIFAKETELVVSMVCPNPYIFNVEESELNVNGVTIPFLYEGTAETGVEAKFVITSNTSVLTIVVNGGLPMVLNYSFLKDDIVYINTRRGERKIQLTRGVQGNPASISSTGLISGGVTSSILYALSQDSRWLELHRVPPNPATNPLGQSLMSAYGYSPTNTIANIKQIKSRGAWWGI